MYIANDYAFLAGMAKKDVLLMMGMHFNLYHDTVWVYLLHKKFSGAMTFLMICFDHETVKEIKIENNQSSIGLF